MDVQFGPNSVEEPNLLYKLQRKVKVFSTANPLQNRGYNLVASSSKYGVIFIASPDGVLSAYHLRDVVDKEVDPQHMSVQLQEKPTHIAVSCDQELLAVAGSQLCIYKVSNFQDQKVSSKCVTIKLDVNPSTFLSALQWNPCIPDTIALAFFDGTLLVGQVTNASVKKAQSKARCICWSPKGKQLVTANSDGTLSQFKPDLTLAKNIPAPNIFEGAPVEALAIYWISTYQFAVVFKNASDNSRPAVTIVNTPKGGQPSCLNYEDICYSMGSNRPWYYYLQGIPQWNLILSSSSNSMEIATLGSTDGSNWLQWCQSDEARPELPLTDKKQENYPVGICIDTCAVHQLPWGENDTLPYMPTLLVVSQTGMLTVFNVINLDKAVTQLCAPPQQFALPAAALTSEIPGEPKEAPAAAAPTPAPQPVLPQPVQIKPQPAAQPAPAPQATMFGAPVTSLSSTQSLFGQALSTGIQPKTESKPKPVEIKPTPVVAAPQAQTQPTQVQQKSAPPPYQPAKPQPSTEANAALKAEQERVNKLKADQELRNMLLKEVNDFQMELYEFLVKSQNTQVKLQRDLDSIDSNFNFQSLDTEQFKKECALEELRSAIVQLKLELVRACAVVAEARTHAEAKDVNQWTQTDPLTKKRVSSVKKLTYYIQTQLDQAQKALDYKWNEMVTRDTPFNKPGQRMIRPILDDVYQPLVKQQEILSRQQAVLRTLRNTLKECDVTPVFKSSLLRSTPFRNKDPLTKLTKNILNMSIEPESNKPKDSFFTPQKLDALRDLLSNHKPVKIKPVNVELREQLAAMRLNYEKSLKTKSSEPQQVKTEPVSFKSFPAQPSAVQPVAIPAKPDVTYQQQPINVPAFTPVNVAKPATAGFNNVARTLFTDEPTPPKPIQQQQPEIKPKQPEALKPQQPAFSSFSGFAPPSSTNMTVSSNTRSMLKEMLQNKQAQASQGTQEIKNDSNTFMGQKICSPLSFSSKAETAAKPLATSFGSKPIADISNMFQKFTPQSFGPDTKSQISVTKSKSNETGEPEASESQTVEAKKEEKITNLFGMKTTPLSNSAQNVPDVLKSTPQNLVAKTEKPAPKPIDKQEKVEKSKENVPEKIAVSEPQKADGDKKENIANAVTATTVNPITFTSPITFGAKPTASGEPQKPAETKTEKPKEKESSPSTVSLTSASSLFAAANASTPPSPPVSKPQPLFGSSTGSPTSQPSIFGTNASQPSTPTTQSEESKTTTKESDKTSIATTSASSLFSAAASQVLTTTTQAATQGTVIETATTTTTASSLFGTSTTQSAFISATETKPTVFSTPTPASATAIFGTAAAATTTSSGFGSPFGSIFATTTAPTFGSGSIFGGSSTPTAAATLFGASSTTATSVFGTATSPAATTAASVFGSATTATQPVFGTPTTTQSIFGSTATASVFGSSTTTASLFGTATPTSTTTASLFGTVTPTTQASIFGSPTTQASVFGSATPTTQPSVFGATTQSTVFGTPTATTQASVFGSPQTTQASVFGSPQTTQASVFGQSSTTSSGSLFGDANNLFAAASISTTTASSPSGGGNIFGGGSSGSIFGSSSSTNVFGGKSTFSQNNPTAASIFGGGGTGTGAAFGQKPATNLWSGGSGTSGFGSPAFGQQATTQSSSIFGGSSGGSFSAPSSGQPFGSPSQTSVFGSAQQQQQQQTSPAFGGSPVFGAKPAFGQPAGFGSSPSGGSGFGSFSAFNKSPSSGFGASATFGGGATFGGSAFGSTSPGKAFSGGGQSPGFGSPTQSNATFESLATQNTLTFGNLAQQTQSPAQSPPAFNNNPSFTGWRG